MSNRFLILIIEDETNIAGFMSTVLNANGFDTLTAQSGQEGIMMASSHCPDIIMLDLGLPDIDGQDVIMKLREWTQTPVIVVSARGHERDKVEALDNGADDYITKPFGTGELLARVRTALRHFNRSGTDSAEPGMYRAGELSIDYEKRRVRTGEQEVHLTQNEYRLVALLSMNAGRVLTYDYILKNIWGPNATGGNQVLRVHMANIRRKLEKNPASPEYIFTEMGVGYRMAEGEE